MSVFVHAQGIKTIHAGGKQWQNYVHVVVESPQSRTDKVERNAPTGIFILLPTNIW